MATIDQALTTLFKGKFIDCDKLSGSRWHNQASKSYHYGFPRIDGLWILPFDPAIETGDHPVKLFILLFLTKSLKIKNIEKAVCRIHPDGSYREIDTPFFPHDYEAARLELMKAIVDESREMIARNAQELAERVLTISELVKLVGANAGKGPAAEIIAQFQLRRAPDILGEGFSYTNSNARIELSANNDDIITTIFVNPNESDLWSKDKLAFHTREEIIAILGNPTTSSKEMNSDRFDSDRIAVHVSYDKSSNVIKITIMDRKTAP